MRKTLKANITIGRGLSAVALAGSLALFGCSTNRTPGYGEAGMSSPAAGSVAPNAASTPGSANTMGSMPNGPAPNAMMISSSPANGESASVDAIADLKAAQAYRGRYLGPAAPGNNSVTPVSSQMQTGQFISPSLYANPQPTVNSSISSAPTPVITSGAGGGDIGGVAFASGASLPATAAGTATTGAASAAIANGVQNVGVTGVSNTVATPVTNRATATAAVPGAATGVNPSPLTNNQVVSTGMTNALSVGGNAAATPVLTTVGAIGNGNTGTTATLTSGSVLGVTNVAPMTVAATPTVGATAAVTNTGATATTGTVSAAAPGTTARVVANTSARAARARGTTTSSGAVRIVTSANGTVLMTNQGSK